ncbi:hypothetical protein CGRA01v4_11055 [Colletotrichum graminicola]|uniref:F-box domain-containing protein n=1 Tax=Colletotrichum graminicola (strain M1.001 / M2 / FGSC 10212) TaxID=645133 RepID=E3QKS6_COLGM|nr:uncharacterized protein GLRG_06608 [Colletotrichum graminicola M1.001]EFQ31464.1 hypothetical protein GLRG_06608 [Colletotrichum graminicola M1.001]WDK19768.1 hypothetical protein CGRA01v4_11055 [Colletotrichum graminicola]
MATCPPTVSLDVLPKEILILILAELPDVRALYQLIRASPAACRLYTAVGAEVLERVLARSVPAQIHQLIRLVGVIRTSTLSSPIAPSFQAFLGQYIRPAADDKEYFPLSPPLSQICSGEKELGAVRKLLLIVRRIACLTSLCIASYRERCLSITPSHKTEREGSSYGIASKPWEERSDGTPYRPRDVGPPAWIEEQRVVRGLWRLQVFHELKTALSEDGTGWSERDKREAADMTLEDLFNGWGPQLEEVLTVVDFVREYTIKPEERLAVQGCDVRLPDPQTDNGSAPSWPVLCQAPPMDAWPGWTRRLNAPPTAWAFFVHLRTNPRSPIRGVEFWPFRKLGLAIWGREKLAKLELTNPAGVAGSKGPLGSREDVEFTWRSLLPNDYLVRLEQRLEEDWQDSRDEE